MQVKAALFTSFIASGQTCVTGSSLLVHTAVYDSFVELLVKRTKTLRLGDPLDPRTQIGALINRVAVDKCSTFVSKATTTEEKGKLLCGGNPAACCGGKGFFFEPNLIETHVQSTLARNEVFGPVIAVIWCESEEEIVQITNGTDFALGASIWTQDFTQTHHVVQKIEAGIVWVNGHHLNDPLSPWGGFKASGIGKENGCEAYESYTKVKSIVYNYGVMLTWFDDEVEARYG